MKLEVRVLGQNQRVTYVQGVNFGVKVQYRPLPYCRYNLAIATIPGTVPATSIFVVALIKTHEFFNVMSF
jgi:hypothetical protein